MNDKNNRLKEVSEIIVPQIPQCCREGWDNCPHVVNRDKQQKKRNIGL